jgi:hypothetical protein
MTFSAVASAESGRESIEFPAAMGKVYFPHKMHQDILQDCTLCHSNGVGKIEGFGKDWVHNTCRACHIKLNKGPSYCNECHKK